MGKINSVVFIEGMLVEGTNVASCEFENPYQIRGKIEVMYSIPDLKKTTHIQVPLAFLKTFRDIIIINMKKGASNQGT